MISTRPRSPVNAKSGLLYDLFVKCLLKNSAPMIQLARERNLEIVFQEFVDLDMSVTRSMQTPGAVVMHTIPSQVWSGMSAARRTADDQVGIGFLSVASRPGCSMFSLTVKTTLETWATDM